MWKELQHSKKTVEVNVEDGDFTERPCEYLKEFGEPITPTGPQKFDMLNLFPRIYVPEDNKVVHQGFILWPDQEAVIAADQELKEFMARRRAKSGRGMSWSAMGGSKWERRQSTVIDGGTGSTATSPGIGRLPFLERWVQRLQGSAIQNAKRWRKVVKPFMN